MIVTRASNNYGPNQFPEKVIPLFITNLIDDIPVPLYGDGQNVRDWLHVDDHCRGVDLLIDKGEPGEVYNIGGGNEVKNVDLTHRILELVGKPDVADQAGGRSARATIAATRSTPRSCSALGWAPRHDVRAGPRRDRRVVSAERVVVAADQGSGSGVPQVLPGAVRQPPLTCVVAGSSAHHRRDRIRRRPPARSAGRRRRARSTRWAHSPAAPAARRDRRRRRGHVDGGRPARPRRGPRGARRRPAGRHLSLRRTRRRPRRLARAGAGAAGQRARHPPPARSGARRSSSACRVLVTGVRAGLPPAASTAIGEDDPIGPAQSRTASASWRRR